VNYRRITAADVDQAATLAVKGLRPDLYPAHLSQEKVRAMLNHFVSSESDFHLAAIDGDRFVGGVAAIIAEMPWFERKEARVVMLYATVPGVGRRLVRQLFDWYLSNPMLRRLLWTLEFDAEPRMMRIAERFGFNSFNVIAAHYKV